MSNYKKQNTREIAFPLGGIGTGCISLAGNGRLCDWEIFNHPDKGRNNGFSHFAIKAQRGGQLLDARVLHGDLLSAASGTTTVRDHLRKKHSGLGVGPDSETLGGMPHFADTTFDGNFPIAQMEFSDPHFPGQVTLLAFNPFIPGNEDDSSLPVAWFEWEVENTEQETLDYTLAFSLHNGLAEGMTQNNYHAVAQYHSIIMSQQQWPDTDPRYSEMAMMLEADNVSIQEYWYRGSWFDSLSLFWREFCAPQPFPPRSYPEMRPVGQDCATLASHFSLAPGEKKRLRCLISWYMPVNYNYWQRWYDKQTHEHLNYDNYQGQQTWRNHYATRFTSAVDVLDYTLRNADRLREQTLCFQWALHRSTLSPALMDAVSANLSVLKSPTCLRLEDGSFYAWEGTLSDLGSCEGSCIHVWNYAQALPFLFPRLSRSMRDLNQRYNLQPSGSLRFRLMLPLNSHEFIFRACVDGQFGEVINIYRDWLLCGDRLWLEDKWRAVRSMIEFAWSEENEDLWDPQQSGVLTGRQHHTLDMELFGANAWLTGLYLAALKAASLIAQELGHTDDCAKYQTIFQRGQQWLRQHLWNGTYFQQEINLSDREVLTPFYQPYEKTWNLDEGTIYDFYWNSEKQEIKYQIDSGCEIDQVMGQWLAEVCNLGEIFPQDKTKRALQAIYQYNFRSMREQTNPCRLFSLNDERGVVICSWPEAEKPFIPLPYAEETMTGFEYQAAAHMLTCGLTDEGEAIVSAIRQRYNGENRNPWNEIECGNHYARSMASYGLLLASSGFRYHIARQEIGFFPPVTLPVQFFFWSVDDSWGMVELTDDGIELTVLYGQLKLAKLGFNARKPLQIVQLNEKTINAFWQGQYLLFEQTITLEEGKSLLILYK